jgi:hypothetical protein
MRTERGRGSVWGRRARCLAGLWLAWVLSACGHPKESAPEAAPATAAPRDGSPTALRGAAPAQNSVPEPSPTPASPPASPPDLALPSGARELRAPAAPAPQKPTHAKPTARAVRPQPSSAPATRDGSAADFGAEAPSAPRSSVQAQEERRRDTLDTPVPDDAPAPAARAKKSASPKALFEQLQSLKLATPDCPSARDRSKAICDLASQICGLMERDPDVASTLEYCHNAKSRCTEATRRTSERCGE